MKKFLGIDFGGTRIRGIVMDEKGIVLDEIDDLTMAKEGQQAILGRIFNLADRLFEKHEITAIGIGTPGPIDYLTGIVLETPNMPFRNVPLKKLLEEKYQVPVGLDRDANTALIGEHWMGDGKGYKNVAMIIWGTGVGGAVIIDNKIFRGHSNMAGELGHMIIEENGPHCNMGHNGCLESLIGGKSIETKYGRGLKEIADGARNKNPEDQKIITEIGYNLKIGLKNIVTLFDPEVILLDGGCTKDLDLFIDNLSDMPIKLSQFARKAGVMGAVRLAMDAASR